MNQIAMLESLIEVLKNQMAIIEQQANDLKCCGNCKHYDGRPDCHYMQPESYCYDWYSDELKRGDRQ